MLILGKPGSGKTHLANQMLLDKTFYSGKFDRILYIGPTRYKNIIHDKYNTSTLLDTKWIE
jgi:chromosomal replication initiation ATPase DnaA